MLVIAQEVKGTEAKSSIDMENAKIVKVLAS